MMNLKFKKSYTFIHTSSNSKRETEGEREKEKEEQIQDFTSQSTTDLENHHNQNPW